MLKSKLLVGVVLLALAPPVGAQTAKPRPKPRPAPFAKHLVLSVDGGYRSSSTFADAGHLARNGESASLSSNYVVSGGPTLSIAGTIPVMRMLGVGIGLQQFSKNVTTSLAASVPHPFFFNTPRALDGAASGVSRGETALHIQARGVVFAGRKMQVMAFGGPTFFRAHQDMVEAINWQETYPYDAVQFTSAQVTRTSTSKIGFNLGGDVAYYFTPRVGVGGGVLASRASADLPSLSGGTISTAIGGVSAGGGLRLRF